MKKEYKKSILDGIIQGVLVCFFPKYIVSVFFVDEPIELNIVFTIILCVLSIISFYYLILRKKEKILLNSFISFMVFLIILTLNFINLFTLNIKILPSRETSNADGLLIIFFVGSYLFSTVILRLLAFIIAFIIKKIKWKNGHRKMSVNFRILFWIKLLFQPYLNEGNECKHKLS